MTHVLPARSIVMFGLTRISAAYNVDTETNYSLTLNEEEIAPSDVYKDGFDTCWVFGYGEYIIYFRKCDLV